MVAVGLSKGFDSICHSLLLAKLKVYGVHDSAIRLIQSYLSGRFHRVKCNEKVSDWLPLRLGVPQGSLLGPLFLKYLCEWCQLLSWIFLPTSVCWWHNAVYSPWKPLHTWIYTESRHRLTLWFTANYLKVNATKTQAMTLGKSQYPYNLFIGDKSIEIEPTLKILGVTLDRDLSFKPHVAIMLKKAYAKIAALRRIKRLVPSDVMISLYKAYVLSQLEYCCPLLRRISNALKNNIERTNHYYNVYGWVSFRHVIGQFAVRNLLYGPKFLKKMLISEL